MKNLKKNDGFTLIEILVVIGIIAILAVIVLIAINPARQFAQARNTQRTSNVNAILNAIGQYMADNKGNLPPDMPVVGATESISDTGADLCDDLADEYLQALPSDPDKNVSATGEEIEEADCGSAYDSGYDITHESNGRITVFAPGTEQPPATEVISVTR